MPVQNKQEQNEQFYNLLKEILDTQTAIVSKLEAIEKKVSQNKAQEDLAGRWRNM